MKRFLASRLFRRHFTYHTLFIAVVIGVLLVTMTIRAGVDEANLQRYPGHDRGGPL